MNSFVSFVCGLLFGAGLLISGMTDPSVVIGFLNVSNMASGQWDPSLMFVMAGALGVYLPLYHFVVKKRISDNKAPVYAEQYHLPKAQRIDRPLLLGAAAFGLGWGISGICPGPGIVNLPTGSLTVAWFVACMLGGIYLASRVMRR
ncbi:DUF6691 family protein [Motiliproteus sp. SC1-56]|uniref:DUF6691 family protein n=1 Tax=Motiliproteus sp. SC1-56 TaxID=2799565 RepID=UPI001A8C1DB3|nr:DUF6691 family protein [Motiliproteus sp. SC1-56]